MVLRDGAVRPGIQPTSQSYALKRVIFLVAVRGVVLIPCWRWCFSNFRKVAEGKGQVGGVGSS